MTPQELVEALRELDKTIVQKDSFSSWLSGETQTRANYDLLKERIETAFPGMVIVYVDVTWRQAHALIANDRCSLTSHMKS